MKIQGYGRQNRPIETADFLELAEVSICASPLELRRIASFLQNCADQMEIMGESYDHVHLSDQQQGFQDSPHLVVFNAQHPQ